MLSFLVNKGWRQTMKITFEKIIILILPIIMSILLILPENTVKIEAKLGHVITSGDVGNVMNAYMQSHKK